MTTNWANKTKEIPEPVQRVLKELKINDPKLLGKGGEGYVFTHTSATAIKIYDDTYHGASEHYLRSLKQLQDVIVSQNLPFQTPQILEIGQVGAMPYTIETRLSGILMEHKFPTLNSKKQYRLLESYYQANRALNGIALPESDFGTILERLPSPIRAKSWPKFLEKMLDMRIRVTGNRLRKDVINLEAKIEKLKAVIHQELVIEEKSLVHADYFVNQVLVNDRNEISAVLDISYHAVAGDKRLDAAGVFFFEGMPHYTDEHIQFLTNLSAKDFGPTIHKFNEIYRLYYCFYFADTLTAWYGRLINNLNDEKIWRKIDGYLGA